jgi:hypothetical protein
MILMIAKMLMITKGYESATPSIMPNVKAVEVMTKYNDSLQQAGVLRSRDNLHPPSMGARVTFFEGKPKMSPMDSFPK